MVLIRAVALLVLMAGCNQSLFDNNVNGSDGGGSGSDDGQNVASMCPTGCLGDAAADIDGSRSGWRYLEDARDRTWTPMTAASDGYVGAVSPNAIETCAANPSAAGCVALPGALLVTSAGNTAAADPALEFKLGGSTNTVVTLTVRVYVPTGQPEQRVRLYRNSREDVLFTANAAGGALFERAINVDALALDRFVLAIAPSAMGAAQVGVHFYVSPTGEAFPKDCQFAVDFNAATGNNVANPCGTMVNYREWDSANSQSMEVAPTLTDSPFPEMGLGADIPLPRYYLGADVMARSGDTTTQFWVRHDAFDGTYNATAFSDLDFDAPFGGLEVSLFESSGTKQLFVGTCTGQTGNTLEMAYKEVAFPNDTNWHFVRVTHAGDQVRICIDGTRVGTYVLAPGEMQSAYEPRIGRNVVWLPTGAFFDGGVDDVRVFTGALPCDP